jgi:dipeptidyl aminopeptidase/acylaminoacyl peptidase
MDSSAAFKITPELEETLKKVLERVKTLYPLNASNDWEWQDDKDDVSVNKKTDAETGLDVIRGEGVVPMTPQEIRQILFYDNKGLLELDKNKESIEVVENIGDKYWVVHSKVKSPSFMVTPRDVVVLATWVEDADGTVYIVGRSVTHPKIPEVKSHVRADVLLYAWVMKPTKEDPTKSVTIRMLQTDPKGMIPKALVNSVAKDEALIVANMKTYAEKKKGK